MKDVELLRALAKDKRASGAAYACAIAARIIKHHPTHAELSELTGYERSTVTRACQILDELAPGWNGNHVAPDVEVLPSPLEELGDLDLLPVPPKPTPVWQRALTDQARLARNLGERSWDLYRDIYAPAADVCLAEGVPGDLVALVADYFRTVTEEPIDRTRRQQIGVLVKQFGKASLYGVREAVMGGIDLDDRTALLLYARKVCQRVLNERRDNGS